MSGRPTVEYQRLLQDVVGRPGDAGGLYRLGCALHDNGRWGGAAAAFAKALSVEADHKALTNYGWNLHLSGRTEEGIGHLERAIEMAPHEGMPRALLAQALGVMGRDEEALFHGRRSVENEPGAAINHVALSFCLMRCGHWLEGWLEYEHRINYILPEFLNRPYRLWRGELVKTLYIECEQGLGDSIFAARWFNQCFERAEKTIIYCHGPLYSLFAKNIVRPDVVLKPLPQPLPEADAWTPTMSIPAALEIDTADFPGVYLRA